MAARRRCRCRARQLRRRGAHARPLLGERSGGGTASGGKLYLLEHVAADKGTAVWYAQQLVAPVFFIVANGCTFRDVASVLHADRSGFEPFAIETLQAPMPIPVVRPHLIATAVKKALL